MQNNAPFKESRLASISDVLCIRSRSEQDAILHYLVREDNHTSIANEWHYLLFKLYSVPIIAETKEGYNMEIQE